MSRKVPKSRKTPIEHLVHDHERAGVHVHKYHRGHGERPEDVVAPRPKTAARQGASLGFGPLYNVTIKYTDHGPEVFAIRTGNPQSALDVGIEHSRAPSVPKVIVLRRR